MTRTRTALVTAIAALGIAASGGSAQAAESWTQVGGPISAGDLESSVPATSDLKRIAGVPHVAWAEGGAVRVARLSGSTWVAVGGAVNHDPSAAASAPSLAAGPGDVPWISWLEDQDGLIRVRVARFEASSGKWVEVAPGSTINKITSPEPFLSSARQAKLVFLDGRAHVVFRQENPSAYEVGHVRLAADGNSWERLAPPPVANEPYFSTAHVAAGALYAAIRDLIGGISVSRYNASNSWTALGGLANPTVEGEPVPVETPIAMTDAGGVPHVLSSTSEAIYVTRFAGGAWENVDGTVGQGDATSLRVIGGRLYVAWTGDTAAHVSRLNGNAWEETAPLPAGAVDTGVLTGAGGVPYLSYAGTDGRLRVARLDGTTAAGPDDNDDSEAPQQATCGRELTGTKRGDRLTGTGGRDLIHGLRGDDRILGLGGDDCLFGDQGDDRIEGGDGIDVLDGGDGDDSLTSGAGNDTVRAGSGDDLVDSRGRGFDTIDCGPGRDRALVGDLDVVRNCERVQNVD